MNSNDPISVVNMLNAVRADNEQGIRLGTGDLRSGFYRNLMAITLSRIAMSRFDWTGLPERVTGELIEQLLLEGRKPALHIPTEAHAPILYTGVGVGNINNERVPSEWQLTMLNGAGTPPTVPWGKVAICDPRGLRVPTMMLVWYYADLFGEFDKAMRSNLRAQKTPLVIVANQDQKLTMRNIVEQYERGEPTIYTYSDSGSLNDAVQAFPFKADYNTGDMLVDRRQAWNDCMTLLGIDNSNQDKRERLVSGEVSGNNQQIAAMRDIELSVRKEFADKANELYDLDIKVEWSETMTDAEMPMPGSVGAFTAENGNTGGGLYS